MPDPPEEPRIFQPGAIFRDHYEVISLLGEGSAGQVYEVEHHFTGQRFALKVSHLKDRNSASQMARALNDARAGYGIQHRNVVRVIDLAVESDGMVWQLMDRLDGCSVSVLLTRYGRLSPIYAIDLVIEVCWGLQAAHEQQTIHRDVHPSNVFVTSQGEVKVLDFSLAKVITSALKTTAGTRSIGTRPYMAPEQIRGAEPTAQFDVYALGLVLWQLLVGRHPFAEALENDFALVQAQLTREPASLVMVPGLPAYCDEVIRGATAKDPLQRYEGMWPLARALLALRARLLADPEGAALREPPRWERSLPILRDPAGYQEYNPPRSLPGQGPEPALPSARVVVPGAPAVARHIVAATVPMAAVDLAPAAAEAPSAGPVASPTASPLDVGAPTVRAPHRPPAKPRRLWPLLLTVPVLGGVGVGVWKLVDASDEHPTAAPKASAAAPKGSASGAAASPHRAPAPRPTR